MFFFKRRMQTDVLYVRKVCFVQFLKKYTHVWKYDVLSYSSTSRPRNLED